MSENRWTSSKPATGVEIAPRSGSTRPTDRPSEDEVGLARAIKERRKPRYPDFMAEVVARKPMATTTERSVKFSGEPRRRPAAHLLTNDQLTNGRRNTSPKAVLEREVFSHNSPQKTALDSNDPNCDVEDGAVLKPRLLPPSFFEGETPSMTVSGSEVTRDQNNLPGRRKVGGNDVDDENENDDDNDNTCRLKGVRRSEKEQLPPRDKASTNLSLSPNPESQPPPNLLGMTAEIVSLKRDLENLLRRKQMLKKLEDDLTEQKRVWSENKNVKNELNGKNVERGNEVGERNGNHGNVEVNDRLASEGLPNVDDEDKENNIAMDGKKVVAGQDDDNDDTDDDDFLLTAIRGAEKNVSTLKSWMQSDQPKIREIRNRIEFLSLTLTNHSPT